MLFYSQILLSSKKQTLLYVFTLLPFIWQFQGGAINYYQFLKVFLTVFQMVTYLMILNFI